MKTKRCNVMEVGLETCSTTETLFSRVQVMAQDNRESFWAVRQSVSIERGRRRINGTLYHKLQIKLLKHCYTCRIRKINYFVYNLVSTRLCRFNLS